LVIRPTRGWFNLNLIDVWRYRDLLFLLVHRDFVAKYKQTILGPAWFILQPLLTTVVFSVIFGNVAKIPTDGLPPMHFYLAGLLGWNYFAQTFQNAYYSALAHNTTDGQSQAASVSGHQAWETTFDVSYTNAAAQGVTWTDEQAAVVVVDNGTAAPAVFFVSVPQTLNEANITTLVTSLQLIGAPASASATASASTSSQFSGHGPCVISTGSVRTSCVTLPGSAMATN